MNDKKKPNGYSIRSSEKLNNFLDSLKRRTGAKNIAQLIWVMSQHPDMPNYLFDQFRDTAFEFTLEQKRQYEKENKVEPSGTFILIPTRVKK